LAGEEHVDEGRRFVGTTRLEAFSDGVFAIAITLLVLDLAIRDSGPALDRVADAWPFYLAYVVSFLTIGAAWLAHTAITDRLTKADLGLLRLNLLLLLFVAVLPFPTRLVAEGLDDVSGERVFVAMEHLYGPGSGEEAEETDSVRRSIVPVVVVYGLAILVGLVLPAVAVGLYCAIAVFLVVPFGELRRLFMRRT
jgi:uncharacterized membrane protein